MKAAFIIFHNVTAPDFVGVNDPLIRFKSINILPDFAWQICA